MERGILNESGERIIQGSRRPDGTYRKDVRIKAGYVAQDEQPVYKSEDLLVRRGFQRCPGLDESTVEVPVAKLSKAAKKNEKRKQKRVEGQVNPSQRKVAPIQQEIDEARAADTEAGAEDPEKALRKKISALKKKVRQANTLEDKQTAGEKLTQEELDKVANAKAWQGEIESLMAELSVN